MSDYEDDPEKDENTPTVYIRRVPDYRSAEVRKSTSYQKLVHSHIPPNQAIKLYEDIDMITDPSPDKEKLMKGRKLGPPLENVVPPKARSLKNRIRKWQVKAELLDENPHWGDGRVAPNGKAWGDEEDPVDDDEKMAEDKKRKAEGDGGQGKKRKRPAATKGKVQRVEAEQTLQKLVGEDGVETLFDD